MATAGLVAAAAAMLYAVGAALEHQASRRERARAAFDPRLLLRLLRRRRWLAGGGVDIGGAGLQALALALGPLALVQPIVVGSQILALPAQAILTRRRVRRHELTAVITSGAGLAVLIVTASPGPGVAPSRRGLALATAGVAAAAFLLVVVAWRRSGAARAALLGMATGTLLGLGAALVKACFVLFARHPLGVFAGWELYVLVVVEIAALALNQNAFQAGRLAVSLTGITLFDPLVSIAVGVAVFQETLSLGGVRTVLAIIAAIVTALGIWLVSSAWATRR